MAQKTDIRLRRSDTAGKIPTSANLSDGELAINTNSGALYFKKSDGTIITVHDNTILHIDSDTTVDSETGTAPKIGIGTTSPSFKLDVVGDGRFSGQNNLLYLDSGATGSPQIQFRQGTNRKSYVRYENSRTTFDIVNEFGNVALWTGSSGSEIERLTVDTSGNVGIGTTSPNARLEVKASAPTLKVAANERTTEGQSNTTLTLESQARESTNDRYSRYNFIVDPNDNFGHASLQIHYLNDGTDYGERLRIDSSGRLGVGTASPERKLHVEADGQLVIAKFESGNAAGALIDIENDATLASNAGAYAGVRFYNDSGFEMALTHITESSGNGYVQIGTAWASGGEKLVVHSNGNVGIGTTSPDVKLHLEDASRVDIKFEKTGSETHYIRKDGNFLRFRGHDDSTVLFELKNNTDGSNAASFPNGNLGIGTTSPNCALHVNGQQLRIANGGPILTLQDTTDDDDHTIRFQDNGGTTRFSITSSLDNFNFITNGSRDITFQPNDTEAVRITSAGSVGIGTTSPSAKLHVQGPSDTASISTSSTPGARINNGGAISLWIGSNAYNYGYIQSIQDDGTNNLKPLSLQPLGGNAGIGTTNPQGTLHLRDTTARLYIQSNDGSSAHVTFGDATDVSRGGIEYTSTDDLIFSNNNFAERMRIRYTGAVGIGTSSPAKKLEVDFTGDTVGARFTRSDTTGSSTIEFANSAGVKSTIGFNAGTNEFDIKHNSAVRFAVDNNGAVTFNEAFTFPTTDGTSGQVLKTNGSGTITWADETGGGSAATSITDADLDTKIQVEESADEDVIRFDVAGSEIATMTDDGVILNDGYNFEGDVVGATKFKAQAGEALTIGDAVYISGISGNTVIVSKADADDSSKMPAFGLAGSTVSLNAAVEIVTFGTLLGVDTSTPSFALGEELYVSTTAGALTNSAPTGSSSLIQKIGKVTRVDASAGSIKVMGAGRTNATPNLDEGRLFVGNSSNQAVQGDNTLYVDMANSRIGINTTNPSYKLHVGGSGKSYLPGGIQLDSTNRIDFGNGNQYITGANDTSLTLATDGSASLTVLDNGDVGIGTTSPALTYGGKGLQIENNDTAGINLHDTTGAELDIAVRSGDVLIYEQDGYPIRFGVNGTEKMRINTTGLGIGINSPQALLHVNGTTRLSDHITLNRGGGQFITKNDNSQYVLISGGNSGDSGQIILGGGTNGTYTGNFIVRTGTTSTAVALTIDSSQNATFSNNVTVTGNLTVDGTTTTLNTATLDVEDKNITLNYSSGDSSSSADGAGITIQDAVDASTDATILWDATADRFDFSHDLELVGDGSHIYFGNNNIFIGENSNTNKLELRGGGNTTAHTVYIDNTGQLGLGTSAPGQKLDVRDGTITSRDSTNTNYAELDRFVGLTLKGNGAGDRHVKTPNADNLVLGTNDLDRVTILGTGNVGIHEDTPLQALHVSGKQRIQSKDTHSSDPALYITDNADDVADQNYNSIHLDYNLSGSDTLATTDRTHRGMFLDIDSSASGGDNANEHRIYGIDVDIDFNGDSDLVVGGKFHVENNNSSGSSVTNIYGIQAFGINDTSGTARGTNTYGGYFVGQLNHSSTQTSDVNLYGTRSRAYLSTTAIGAGINDVTGSYNEIEVDDPGQSTTVDQAYVGRFIFNNDDTTNNNVSFNDTYLIHGTYGGGAPAGSNSYGIYMHSNVPKNYFGSNVGIGTTSPDALLEVSSDSDDGTNAPIVKITNESTTLADGAVVGTLQFVNKDASSGPHIGHIQGIANSAEERSVELAFATGNVGTTSERLRIDKDGNIGISTTAPKAKLQVEEYGIDTTETSTTSTSQVAIHTFATTDFRSARFTIQVTNSTDSTYHTSEILLVHDGTTAYITEFGEIHTGTAAEATFDADIDSGNVRLLATPASTDSIEFKVICHSVTV